MFWSTSFKIFLIMVLHRVKSCPIVKLRKLFLHNRHIALLRKPFLQPALSANCANNSCYIFDIWYFENTLPKPFEQNAADYGNFFPVMLNETWLSRLLYKFSQMARHTCWQLWIGVVCRFASLIYFDLSNLFCLFFPKNNCIQFLIWNCFLFLKNLL